MRFNLRRIRPRRSWWLVTLIVVALSLVPLGLYRQAQMTVPPALAQTPNNAPLPTRVGVPLSMSESTASPAAAPFNRRFTVMIRGGMKTYDRLEATIQEDLSGQVRFKLTMVPNGRGGEEPPKPRIYKAKVAPGQFEAFWASLYDLAVDQLPSAGPAGHRSGPKPLANDGQEPPSQMVIDGLTYGFTVQTQAPVFTHQFQVYAPSAVADRRYEAITTEFYRFLKAVFGDRPFTDLLNG